ncbi:ATP phosphoribosyltransferase =_ HisGs [hydrothermal vent metagenome]|uniref:ATP phosphoribosyltransferase n=1 Tax=hydrothermal vent metagenome TaxID=652676 RepID=A0A3B1B2M5_9ZZZZ
MSLIIAIPSKGRLKERALEIFANADYSIQLPRDNRGYQGNIENHPDIEIAFLSASEIARELAFGNVHMGITGEDLARENITDVDNKLEFSLPLEFGHADVIVAVPDAWADVETMADLDDVAAEFRARYGRRLRIATKYWNLTQGFFADHGIAVYRIVESLGATEGAPAAGSADVIVDITSTGSTIRANQLKILSDGIILRSQANLIVSKIAVWDAQNTAAKQKLLTAISASLAAC